MKAYSSEERAMNFGWIIGVIHGNILGFLGIGGSFISCHISCLGF